MDSYVVEPGCGVTIEGPVGGALTFMARADQTGGSLTVLENIIPPGEGPPLHVHDSEDEAWYVLEGTLRFQFGDTYAEAPTGSFVFVPRGNPHCFANVGDTPARILVLFTPSGMERFFERFAAETAPNPDTFHTIGRDVGMEVCGPPLLAAR
jgi:quercetin dioxygenase-like cupin family protein